MNIRLLSAAFSLSTVLMALPVKAQEESTPAKPGSTPAAEKVDEKTAKSVKGWGNATDPASDCKFLVKNGTLSITVPGSQQPHDLSSELKSNTAPRVLTPLIGDFDMQVKVEGEFEPGGESAQPGRTGYTGAGLVVFADANNYVRLERATLQHAGDMPRPYANFEIRVDGELQRIGTTGDLPPLDISKPLWLRLSRSSDRMEGAISQDGVNWITCDPKDLTADAWHKEKVHGGVAAISTSVKDFTPSYSEFSAVKPGAAKPAGKEAKPDKASGDEKEKPATKKAEKAEKED
jgi:regulation of enolase protein 1 (concanavalin A-like superfamily)